MAEIYKRFSLIGRHDNALDTTIKNWDNYDSYRDFSDEAAKIAFEVESLGGDSDLYIRLPNGKINGYIEGKKKFNLTVTAYWLPDLKTGELNALELYEDYPKWLIDKTIPEQYHLSGAEIERFQDPEFIRKGAELLTAILKKRNSLKLLTSKQI